MLAALVLFAGCSGSTTHPTVTPPTGPTLTIQGRVVEADHPTLGLAQCVIKAQPSGRSATSLQSSTVGQNGTFVLTEVPRTSGTITLQVNPVAAPNYQAAAILIVSPAATDTVVNVTVALLPNAAPTPTSMGLSPLDLTIEIGMTVQFNGAVTAATGPTTYAPSWVTLGPAGTLSSTGLFTATAIGVNRIYAFSGAVGAQTTVTVVGQRGPFLDSVIVDPLSLSASGGTVTFTVGASDGEGVASVTATVYPPGGGTTAVPLTQVAGGTQAATFRATYAVAANSNPISGAGVQLPQTYSVRFDAVDNTGHHTLSDYTTFTVLGLGTPPPPPS
jgi:hypothetical protein